MNLNVCIITQTLTEILIPQQFLHSDYFVIVYMQIWVQILTERLCLSALLELCRVDIYTQPVDAKIKHKRLNRKFELKARTQLLSSHNLI